MTDLSNNRLNVEVANQQNHAIDETALIAAATMILKDYGLSESQLSIAVVDDPTIRDVNQSYLSHDYETDVISFPLDGSVEEGFLNGQLVVSSDTAARLASELGVSLQDELMLYVVHGTLHLVGLNDKTEVQAVEMRNAEKDYLTKLGVKYCWPDEDDPPPVDDPIDNPSSTATGTEA